MKDTSWKIWDLNDLVDLDGFVDEFDSRHDNWRIRPRGHDFVLINVFCVVIVVKKCAMASPGSLLLFCTA